MQTNILFNFVPNTFLRNIIRLYAKNNRRIQNPGLQKRINVLSEKQEPDEFDDDDLDDLETDFMNTNQAHKLHEHEIESFKEKQKFWIVRRKYFKENQVNFLTWNDKEQIRHLYNTNPTEWTVEKLSEGFPALPQTISKILKAKWQPRTENRQKNHDMRVENNWKLFKTGKLPELPPDVIQHVSKFSDRKPKIDMMSEKIIIKQTNQNETSVGEYGSIIENYNKLINKKNNIVENVTKTEENINEIKDSWRNDDESRKFTNHRSNRYTTLSELRKNIARDIDSGKDVNEYDKMILKEVPDKIEITKYADDNETNSIAQEPNEFKIDKLGTYRVESNKKLAINEDTKALQSLKYPERIIIPKEKYKRGITYKVNDCYYDDDGQFLYRVPGMY